MIVQYDWPPTAGNPPSMGTVLNISGNPDRAVLKGEVVDKEYELVDDDSTDSVVCLVILIKDGQEGEQELVDWVASNGDIGVDLCERDPVERLL